MSGSTEQNDVVLLEDDDSGRVLAYIRTLRRLPDDRPWILVGGLAVNARVGRSHRATNDIDTMSTDRAALVVLKTLSFPERIDGSYRHKAGSDIQDLYRLVEGVDLDELAEAVAAGGPELTAFVGAELRHYFTGETADLRYAHVRMRSFARNADSEGISEAALSTLGFLGAILSELDS